MQASSQGGKSRQDAGSGRRRLVKALIALGAVLTFLAIYSIWVERQLLDTDDWVDTSAELIEEETIRVAVADYLVDELYTHVDMEREIEELLPEGIEDLAGPAAGGLRQGAGQATEALLDTGTATELWKNANRTTHRELVAVLEGRDEYLLTDDGVVTLDLDGMLVDLAEQVGVGSDLVDEIPPEAASVVILRSDDLETAQDATRAIKGLSILLTLLAILAFAGAVFLSRGQRWVAVLGTAVGMAAAAFAVLVVRSIAGGIVVDELVVDPSIEPAAASAWSIGTGLLYGVATSVILIAAALAAAAWLISPAPSARRARKGLAPGLRDSIGGFYAALGLLLGLYFLVSGAQTVRTLVTALVIAGLAAVGLRELRRITAAEFPDAPRWSGLDEVWARMKRAGSDLRSYGRGSDSEPVSTDRPRASPDALGSRGDDAEREPGEAEPGSAHGPEAQPGRPAAEQRPADWIEQLERLSALHERGVITDQELQAEKARILGE